MSNVMPIKWTMDEMDKFLENYNLSNVNQEKKIENLNRPITSTEIKFFQQTKSQDQMASQVNSTKNL